MVIHYSRYEPPDARISHESRSLTAWRSSSNTAAARGPAHAVHGGFMPTDAIQQAHAERVLKVTNRLGNSGLRQGNSARRFRHTPALDYGKQQMKVAQPNSAANPFIPSFAGQAHNYIVIGVTNLTYSVYTPSRASMPQQFVRRSRWRYPLRR